jgi:hypothetical protein
VKMSAGILQPLFKKQMWKLYFARERTF